MHSNSITSQGLIGACKHFKKVEGFVQLCRGALRKRSKMLRKRFLITVPT